MSENITEKIIKISELNAKTENEIKKIAYSDVCLVPCKETIQGEEVKFEYDLSGLVDSNNIRNCRVVEKIRFLLNVISIFNLGDEYKIDLNSNNIYYDYNFNAKLKERDVTLREEVVSEQDLVLQYKSLIGFVFSKEYTYEDFYKGGIDLLSKNNRTKKYLNLNSIEEIKEELLKDLKEKEIEDKEKLIEITKTDYKIKKYSMCVMSFVLAVLLIYTIFSSVFLIPLKSKIIDADNYFMQQNYEYVIRSLENTRGMKLDKYAKYKLAYSYAISEELDEKRKNNILPSIGYNSDENILDYWVSIGKREYDESIDLAKKIQNKQYLLFAYLKKQKLIEDNNKISGEEKEKILKELKSEINELDKEINGASKNNSENKDEISKQDSAPTTENETTDTTSNNDSQLELIPAN